MAPSLKTKGNTMSQKSRFVGRFKMTDAGRPTRDVLAEREGRVTGRTGDVAEKMELARFPGHQVVAERDGQDLVIYQIGDPDGIGVNIIGTGDRAPKTLADLQKTYDAAFGRRETPKQKLDRHAAGECLADRVRNPVR
jgi:hypothetical protein